jgi:hypothetical protein
MVGIWAFAFDGEQAARESFDTFAEQKSPNAWLDAVGLLSAWKILADRRVPDRLPLEPKYFGGIR